MCNCAFGAVTARPSGVLSHMTVQGILTESVQPSHKSHALQLCREKGFPLLWVLECRGDFVSVPCSKGRRGCTSDIVFTLNGAPLPCE